MFRLIICSVEPTTRRSYNLSNSTEKILSLIKERKITKARLERECGLSNGTIHNWETGRNNPSYGAIVKIADYFHISREYLLGKDISTTRHQGNFIDNILNIANEHGYTNKRLCDLLGKNSSYISDWKSGKSKPKADELLILAKEFNVSVDYLLRKTNVINSPINEQQNNFTELINNLSFQEREKVKEYIEFLKYIEQK